MEEKLKLPSPLPFLTRIRDPRQPGKREHSWEALWLLVLLAIACRQENILAMAQWLEDQREWLLGTVKIRAVNGDGRLPKQATLYRFFWHLEAQIDELEAGLHEWAKAVLRALAKDDELLRISLDGKYLRGSVRKRKAANPVSCQTPGPKYPAMLIRAPSAQRGGDPRTRSGRKKQP